MDTALSKEDKIFILESKIRAFNEYLYNYEIDLSLEDLDPQASDKIDHYDNLRANITTAQAKKQSLEAKLVEVMAE